MLVWLASFPRSGNTFFRILLHQVYGLSTRSVYEELPPPEMAELLGSPTGTTDPSIVANDSRTWFVKTHDLPGDDDFPAIYIVRDGRDALVSYARFILNYEHIGDVNRQMFIDTLRTLVEEDGSFGGWGTNVATWRSRRATTVISFERLIHDPLGEVERALSTTGFTVPRRRRQPPTFPELKERLPRFFTSGQIGYWRREMPPNLEEQFWSKHGAIMEAMGYERNLEQQPYPVPVSRRPGTAGLHHGRSIVAEPRRRGA